MLQMNQIDQIKELQRQGLGLQEIARRLHEETVPIHSAKPSKIPSGC